MAHVIPWIYLLQREFSDIRIQSTESSEYAYSSPCRMFELASGDIFLFSIPDANGAAEACATSALSAWLGAGSLLRDGTAGGVASTAMGELGGDGRIESMDASWDTGDPSVADCFMGGVVGGVGNVEFELPSGLEHPLVRALPSIACNNFDPNPTPPLELELIGIGTHSLTDESAAVVVLSTAVHPAPA